MVFIVVHLGMEASDIVGAKFLISVGGVVHEYILVGFIKDIADGVFLAHSIVGHVEALLWSTF